MAPKAVPWILDQLNEGDEKTPGMRSIYNQSLQQHPCDLLLYNFKISLRKKVKKNTREVVCMVVGIAQLVGHSIKEQVSAFCVKLQNKVLEDIHWSTVSDGC